MKVEYLLPILAGASPLLRILFAIWLTLSFIVGIWVFTIYITQNIRKFDLEEQKPYIEIKREISDFSAFSKNIISQHKESIDQIASKMNYKNMYSSGAHLQAQYKLVKENQRKISDKWGSVKRRIEDILINYGKTQIEDKYTKEAYDDIEQNQEKAVREIMDITDKYFAKRNTFDKQTIESVKKAVFE